MATFDQDGREVDDVELEPVRARPIRRTGFAGLPMNEQGDYELPEVEAVAIRPSSIHPAVMIALGALLVYLLDDQ